MEKQPGAKDRQGKPEGCFRRDPGGHPDCAVFYCACHGYPDAVTFGPPQERKPERSVRGNIRSRRSIHSSSPVFAGHVKDWLQTDLTSRLKIGHTGLDGAQKAASRVMDLVATVNLPSEPPHGTGRSHRGPISLMHARREAYLSHAFSQIPVGSRGSFAGSA